MKLGRKISWLSLVLIEMYLQNQSKNLSLCNKYEFEIDTGDSVPVQERFYKTSKAKKEINRQVEEMLDNDIIEPCMSPWS